MRKNELPNPLSINFGDGKVLVSTFYDEKNAGIVMWQPKKAGKIGDYGPTPKSPHNPRRGEVYLSFSNLESLQVVEEAIAKAKIYLKGKDNE